MSMVFEEESLNDVLCLVREEEILLYALAKDNAEDQEP
jgi:hypothetical protein